MIQQHTLRPHHGRKTVSKRVGRGDGSGKGSYSTRGCKGQNSRTGGGVRPGFEGGQTPLSRRLPKLKGFDNPVKIHYQAVNVESFNTFPDNTTVDSALLFSKRIIGRKNMPLKVLGLGELTKKLKVVAEAVSQSARAKIEKADGEVVLIGKKAALEAQRKSAQNSEQREREEEAPGVAESAASGGDASPN